MTTHLKHLIRMATAVAAICLMSPNISYSQLNDILWSTPGPIRNYNPIYTNNIQPFTFDKSATQEDFNAEHQDILTFMREQQGTKGITREQFLKGPHLQAMAAADVFDFLDTDSDKHLSREELDNEGRLKEFVDDRKAAAAKRPSRTTIVFPPNQIQVDLIFRAQARTTVAEDSTLISTANGGLTPSAVPVHGGPYFGAPSRTIVYGSGSVFQLGARTDLAPDAPGGTLQVQNVVVSQYNNAPQLDGTVGQFIQLQQSNLYYNGLLVGVGETAFASQTSMRANTLDVVGPNARVTAGYLGSGTTQARLSYLFTSDTDYQINPGLNSIISIEANVPEIKTQSTFIANDPNLGYNTYMTNNSTPFSRFPDLVSTTFWSSGDGEGKSYQEQFHIQTSTIVRSLGLQNDKAQWSSSCIGWGESISGAYLAPSLSQSSAKPDQVVASATFGQGISHYIVDLQTNPQNLSKAGYDAYMNAQNSNLSPLSTTAWYTSYTHQWGDEWGSSITYSDVRLNNYQQASSSATYNKAAAYQHGQYLSANLVYSRPFVLPSDVASQRAKPQHMLTAGFEYIYALQHTIYGTSGNDRRGLFTVGITY